jgi:probable DNA repair protein
MPGLLLNHAQAGLLWEAVLKESGLLPGHLAASTLVREVMRAWRLATEFQVTINSKSQSDNDNVQAFALWAGRYRQRLDNRGWLDPDELPGILASRVRRDGYSGPPLTILAPEAMPPAWVTLVESIGDGGGDIQLMRAVRPVGSAWRVRSENPEAELRDAARWARCRLERHPGNRLGVIVDNLAQDRTRIQQIFTEELAPGVALSGADTSLSPFHLSMGQRLVELPMVFQALALLNWVAGEHRFETAGRVLRAPYLAPTREAFFRRAGLDAEIRRRGTMFASPGSVLALASQTQGADSDLTQALTELIDLSERQTSPALPSVWVERFTSWLSSMAWPGFPGLDSGAYQALGAWNELLTEFSSMDPVAGSMKLELAVGWLRRLAGDKVFQPEAREVPVQILDHREAQGLQFDAVWICGWHDEAWPQGVSPSPFLPLSEQRSAGMPGASPDIRHEEAQAVWSQLHTLAPECVFSWPGAEDGRPLRPSSLIAGLSELPQPLDPRESFQTSIRIQRKIEPRPTPELPMIPAGERVRGGVQVLEQQSMCPFRSFAEHRLGAVSLDTPAPGLDPRERGRCVHRTMEYIWQSLGGQSDLLRLDDAALSSMISAAIDRGFDGASINAEGASRRRLLDMEKVRVAGLIADLIEAEKRRPEFSVKEQEIDRSSELGGLDFKVRPDRIDVLPDGREIVLDYKTGSVNPREWLHQRIKSVQLPLYVLANPGQTRAAYFATLRAGDVGFRGMQADADMMPADRAVCESTRWSGPDGHASWEDMLLEWRRKLEQLAQAFRESDIRVDPDRYACLYCHLGTLCRVAERQGVQQGE